jgi:regulatory protein
MSRALHLLSVRPQTEHELSTKLARGGFAAEVVEQVLARLREMGYINDAAFARQWVEERSRLRPVGRRALAAELARKGIDRELVESALALYGESAELAAARALATRAAARYAHLPAPEQRRRCFVYLVGRGFDHDLARTAAGEAAAPCAT